MSWFGSRARAKSISRMEITMDENHSDKPVYSKWSSLKISWFLLEPSERKKLVAATVLQSCLAILDVLGILVLAAVAGLGAVLLTGDVPPSLEGLWNRIETGYSDATVPLLLLGVSAGCLLIAKSLLAFFMNRRIFYFLARRQAEVSKRLASVLFDRSVQFTNQRTSQDLAYALSSGIAAAMNGLIGSVSIIVGETTLVLLFVIVLSAADLGLTLVVLLLFGLVALGVQKFVTGWATRLGGSASTTQISALTMVQAGLRTTREMTTSGRLNYFLAQYASIQDRTARITAGLATVGQVSKYALEVAVIVGGGLLAAWQFSVREPVEAVSLVALYLAAALRVTPSVLRLQQALLTMDSSVGLARPLLQLHEDIVALSSTGSSEEISENSREARSASIRIADRGEQDVRASCTGVMVRFDGMEEPALCNVSLEIIQGQMTAIAGPTGAGKSTLLDVMLGHRKPDQGSVEISGLTPREFCEQHPGVIAYIPQQSEIIHGSVRENVALWVPRDQVNDDMVWEALERAKLADYLQVARSGLETLAGEGGLQFSGGQRQRLGIARALYTRPSLVFLDEATSALDASTESAVTQSLESIREDVTLVVVAHRLATVRRCDRLIYIDKGRIQGDGKFSEVQERVPEFARQAALMGL